MKYDRTYAWHKIDLNEDIIIEKEDCSRLTWYVVCRLFGLNRKTTDVITISTKSDKIMYYGK